MMKDDAEHPDLQSRDYPICEDMSYQMKVWRFERIGWYLLVLLMVCGLIGLFSRGLLSTRDVNSMDGSVRVEYEMFHRNGSMNSMKISVNGKPETQIELDLSGEMLEGFSIESLQPEPLRSRSLSQGMRVWVQTDNQGQATLYLTLRGDGLGFFRSHVTTPGSPGVTLNQFIFP
ncbi:MULTISPECIES: hypothetical protein [Pseudomonas]|jgi:hypothetical protein|uniref:hypothetical protein n=2 Tax=Bacteria TaxID=2 RepID=UPI0039782F88